MAPPYGYQPPSWSVFNTPNQSQFQLQQPSWAMGQLQGQGLGNYQLPNFTPNAPTPGAPAFGAGGQNFASNPAKPMTGLTPDQLRYEAALSAAQPNQTWGNINAGVQSAVGLGNLLMGGYSLFQADKAFNWQKGMAEDNYANSIKSYNTAMADRIRTRYSKEEWAAKSETDKNAELDSYKLNGKGK